MPESQKYRLVTRSDFDGLVCAVLLKELDLIDEVKFVHPKDMQDGKIEITSRDITTNLPYVPACHLAFDHHHSETLRMSGENPSNHIIDASAPSAARAVHNYYAGQNAFGNISSEMMEAVDKCDSAQFSLEEIRHAEGWVLLNFLMDARTGLGRFRQFRVSNYQLMMELIDFCRQHTVDEITELADVKERVEIYRDHEPKMMDQLRRCSKVLDNVVVLDLRNEETIWAGNRFMIYALHPEINTSIHVLWGLKKQNTVFAIGNSIVNRSSKTNVGELCLDYGGGGHANAGTCQVGNDRADAILAELIDRIHANELAPV